MPKKQIKKALLVIGNNKPATLSLVKSVTRFLESEHILYDTFKYLDKKSPDKDIDLAISIGGDGTVLYSARMLCCTRVPILAVRMGDFGFITEIGEHEWQQAFEAYRAGVLGISKRLLLRTTVTRDGEQICSHLGLNDAVVGSAGISKVVRLHVTLGSTALGRYRADGIITATPTGSTAYSAAAGGPILDPQMDALIVNPICPFTLSNRPLVIPGNEHVRILVEEEQRAELMLTVDGQLVVPLQPGDVIHIERAPEKAAIILSDKRNFYEVLRAKLNWSGGPDA